MRGAVRLLAASALCIVAGACGGDDGVTVTYTADGSVATAVVSYAGADGLVERTVDLPWTEVVELGGTFDVELVVSNPGDTGRVSCELLVAGFRPVATSGERSATCEGSGVVRGDSASGSFATSSEDRVVPSDDEGPPAGDQTGDGDGPMAVVVLFGVEGGTVGPYDAVQLEVRLTRLTEEIVVEVDAEALPVGSGPGRSLSAGTLLKRGPDYEGSEHIIYEVLSPPPGGWSAGLHVVEVVAEVSDRTDAFGPASSEFALEFTVVIPDVVAEGYEDPAGRFSFTYPSDWSLEVNNWVMARITHPFSAEPTPYEPDPLHLHELVTVRPLASPGAADIGLFVERARFSAPDDLATFADMQVAALTERGFSESGRSDLMLTHGPAIEVRGTTGSGALHLLFTASADRLYIAQFRADADVVDGYAPVAVALVESLVFVPENEPPPQPLEESKVVPYTFTHPDGSTIEMVVEVPASWQVATASEDAGPGRLMLPSWDPSAPEGERTELRLYVEFLEPGAFTAATYADFYLAAEGERFAGSFTVTGRDPGEVDGRAAVRAAWTAAIGSVDEIYLVVDGFGIRASLRSPEPDPGLMAALMETIRIAPGG